MLILVRGIPGSGKTTFVKSDMINEPFIGNRQYVHLEADMWFTDHKGNYNWTPDGISHAHRWCTNTACIMMNNGVDVVVSNTFTTLKEMRPYLEHANMLGIAVFVFRMNGNYGSVHNVPVEVIEKMKNRFEDYGGEILR